MTSAGLVAAFIAILILGAAIAVIGFFMVGLAFALAIAAVVDGALLGLGAIAWTGREHRRADMARGLVPR